MRTYIVKHESMKRRAIALTNRATRGTAVSLSDKRELCHAFLNRQIEKAELKFPE